MEVTVSLSETASCLYATLARRKRHEASKKQYVVQLYIHIRKYIYVKT